MSPQFGLRRTINEVTKIITVREKHEFYTRIKRYYDKLDFEDGLYSYCWDEIYCRICGEIVRECMHYKEGREYVCKSCKAKIRREEKKIKQAAEQSYLERAVLLEHNIDVKKEKQFNKAVDNIQKQVRNFGKYRNAIEKARKYYKDYGSVPEAMVAIELARLGYNCIPQKKIKRYKVDFFIPDEKMIVEVDGELFHSDRDEEETRDMNIRKVLGWNWKIIHVPAERIQKQIYKLKKVITALSGLE